MTEYRMTMKGVLDLNGKDTGDVPGDTSFVISRRMTAYECRKYPTEFMCMNLAQFSGDDKNSTDLVLEMQVEVDGQWGPYLECNPINVSDSQGHWSCITEIKHVNPPNYPKQCSDINYEGMAGYCFLGSAKAEL